MRQDIHVSPATARIIAQKGVLCQPCAVAAAPLARARGLLGRSHLSTGEGILLLRESSVHMFFMRFPIDAVFVDRDLVVLKVVANLRPWRVARCRGAWAALELPAGAAAGVTVGEQLIAEPPISEAAGIWSDAAVALLVAAVVVAAFARFASAGTAVVAAFFAAVLVVLSAIDIRRQRLPNRIVLPAAAIVLAGRLAASPSRWSEWLIAAAAAFGALLIVHLVVPKALAMGDVKLALLLGAGLGYDVWLALFLGYIAAGVWAFGVMLRRGRAARHQAFALGPFLALGALVILFAQH